MRPAPFAAAALALALLAGPAPAAFVTHSTSLSGSNAGGIPSPGGNIPQFDPALGTLQSVVFTYSLSAFFPNNFLENLTDQFVDVTLTLSFDAMLLVLDSDSGVVDGLLGGSFPADPYQTQLAPFDVVNAEVTGSLSGQTAVTDFAPYVGTSFVRFVVSTEPSVESLTPDDGSVRLSPSADFVVFADVAVTYTYTTPAPAGVWLALSAVPGLLAVRRLRRRPVSSR